MDTALIIQSGFAVRNGGDHPEFEKIAENIFGAYDVSIRNFSFKYGETLKYLRYTQKNRDKLYAARSGSVISEMSFWDNGSGFPNLLEVEISAVGNGLLFFNIIISTKLLSGDHFEDFVKIHELVKSDDLSAKAGYAFYFPEKWKPDLFSHSIFSGFTRDQMPAGFKDKIYHWIKRMDMHPERLAMTGVYNFAEPFDETVTADIISALDGGDRYKICGDDLYFALTDNDGDITALMETKKYDRICALLTEHDILDCRIY